MADLKSLWCYNIGDNVVYGISWVSDLSCWSLKLEEKFVYSKEVINFCEWNLIQLATCSVQVGTCLKCQWSFKFFFYEKPPVLNSRIKRGRFPPMWLPDLLQAITGFWYLKIESGEEVSLSKFIHETGETSSDMIAGFTPGYHWLLIFQNSREEVSPSENSIKIKSENNRSNLIFNWKHSSILNFYTKSVGKFPKKVVHASFLQCSAYIVLGQDDWLRKINSNVLWNHSVRRIR